MFKYVLVLHKYHVTKGIKIKLTNIFINYLYIFTLKKLKTN